MFRRCGFYHSLSGGFTGSYLEDEPSGHAIARPLSRFLETNR